MKLKFKTISSVILSPRMEKALYKGVDFKEIIMKDTKIEKVENINIVYPFYSYDDRDLLSESNFLYANGYYIPASSLKGALLGSKKDEKENSFRSKILFHDVKIRDIKLKNLYKFQYLYEKKDNHEKNKTETAQTSTATYDKKKDNNETNKIPKYTVFFPGVAIEMLESKKEFESEILMKSSEIKKDFCDKLKENFGITKIKLKNYIAEINKVENQEKNQEEYMKKLNKIKCNIQKQLSSNKNMIFLGGYKGILGSLSQFSSPQQDENHKITNGFYIDEETLLPYGLVEVCQ
ncbi:hypothetical protein [Leptotrichia sp. oral taxon 212]|jgi:hypothetical protein|uniref:hypothetical protein n=1 Tax=Leptotrichia sp. oral taxon 212 TaxID=712357 RepID=UPI0006A97267|nr:hypothetical protein [Leptotrichia sp. oral taxon 212]ALA95109.1 hypothetical protein AMK43_02800 [Leptotrichia sp. oral taxon 212]